MRSLSHRLPSPTVLVIPARPWTVRERCYRRQRRSRSRLPCRDGFIGTPVAVGDTLTSGETVITVTDVKPGPVAVVAAGTRITVEGEQSAAFVPDAKRPLSHSMLVAGLEDELDLLMGWLTLLTGDAAERSRPVAGLVISGPAGCGSVELVEEATRQTGLKLKTVDLRTVTTAELLLSRLEAAVTVAGSGTIVLIDALDPLASRAGGIQHQVAAVMRWFLDKVADRDGVACVITSRDQAIAESIDAKSLLPRTLTISPPSRERRAVLLAAELSEQSDVDIDRLANATAGFSALDIAAAVLEARASDRGTPSPPRCCSQPSARSSQVWGRSRSERSPPTASTRLRTSSM